MEKSTNVKKEELKSRETIAPVAESAEAPLEKELGAARAEAKEAAGAIAQAEAAGAEEAEVIVLKQELAQAESALNHTLEKRRETPESLKEALKKDPRAIERREERLVQDIKRLYESHEITEDDLERVVNEMTRFSVKDGMQLAMASGLSSEKAAEVLGSILSLRPEPKTDDWNDPKYYLDRVSAFGLDSERKDAIFKPTEKQREEQRTKFLYQNVNERTKEAMASVQQYYVDYKDVAGVPSKTRPETLSDLMQRVKTAPDVFSMDDAWRAFNARKREAEHEMSDREYRAYNLAEKIEAVKQGVVAPERVFQELGRLNPIFSGLRTRETLSSRQAELDAKMEERLMGRIRSSPLLKKWFQAQEGNGEPLPLDEEESAKKELGPIARIEDAYRELIKSTQEERPGINLESAQTLLTEFGMDTPRAKELVERQREKLSLVELEEAGILADTLEQEKVEFVAAGSEFRVQEISALQKALRMHESPERLQGAPWNYSDWTKRYQTKQEQNEKKIPNLEMIVSAMEKIRKRTGIAPYTWKAKEDVYTKEERIALVDYLFPEHAARRHEPTVKGQEWSESDMEPSGDGDAYERLSESTAKAYFKPKDELVLIDGDPKQKNPNILMEFSEPIDAVMLKGVFDTFDTKARTWKMRRALPEPIRGMPMKDVVTSLSPTSGKMRLPTAIHGSINLERVIGVGKNNELIPLPLEKDPLGFIQVDVPSDGSVTMIMYHQRIPEMSPAPTSKTNEEYRRTIFPDSLNKKQAEALQKEQETHLRELPPECRMLILGIRDLPPHERVVRIENFMRSVGYYDFNNKELFGRKMKATVTERAALMRARMQDLRARRPEILDEKLFAGVCVDFEELTTTMLKASGLSAGCIAGLRIPGSEQATTAMSHSLSYVDWPGAEGERLVIPVDGTPNGVDSEEQALLRPILQPSFQKRLENGSIQEADILDAKLLKTEQLTSDTEATNTQEPPALDSVENFKKPESIPPSSKEMLDRYFQVALSPEESAQMYALRAFLAYSPIKFDVATLLTSNDGIKLIKQQIGQALSESSISQITRAKETTGDKGLLRQWTNLMDEWDKIDARQLQNLLDVIKSQLSQPLQRAISHALNYHTKRFTKEKKAA
ncbi:MAG: hypothetical protein ABIB04_04990 [Patescibacteria group bacterium]